VKESHGATEQEYEVGTIVLQYSNENHISFVLTNPHGEEKEMYVGYLNEDGEYTCSEWNASSEIEAKCAGGIANIGLYFSWAEETDECSQCMDPVDSTDAVSYKVEVPCTPMCVPPTDSPSSSPTSSPTASPSASPTISPTASPTASPSTSPSSSPSSSPSEPVEFDVETESPSNSPTDCYDKYGITRDSTVGNDDEGIDIENAIKVSSVDDGESLTYTVTNIWGDESTVHISYLDNEGQATCSETGLTVNESFDFESKCVMGIAKIGVHVSLDSEESLEDCGKCKEPESDSESAVSYTLILSCEDLCGPTVPPMSTDCYDEIPEPELLESVGEDLVDATDIVEIIESTEVSVSFRVSRSDDVNHLYLGFEEGVGSSICVSQEDQQEIYTASCDGGYAQLSVHFSTLDEEDEACNTCSSPPPDSVSAEALYFNLPCGVICVDEGRRRRMDDTPSKESFTAEEIAPGAGIPTVNDEDVPYCVSEDFPCQGEGDDMVHVCHYSARKGYQTFCIPETDSDIMRFYPNDYCGPCEGGYGGIWS